MSITSTRQCPRARVSRLEVNPIGFCYVSMGMPRRFLVFLALLAGLLSASSAARASATGGIQVLWGGSWWNATALESRANTTKIHYTGWGPEWDEWVESARIRKAPPPLATPRVGIAVEIEWKGSYWPGRIVQKRDRWLRVHYDGWGDEWDEWVELRQLLESAKGRGP